MVVKSFAEKGARVSSSHIPHLRAGRASGDIISERAACAALLSAGLPVKKDELYEEIARTATSSEIRLRHTRCPQRFSSRGFTLRVADALGLPLILIDEIFRAMRTEAVMSTQEAMQPDLLVSFDERVNDFLGNYDDPNTLKKSPTLQTLCVLRHGVVFTPDNFYRVIYDHPSNRFIGAWATHEVDWLAQFYAFRLQSPYKLSPLDRVVLDETRQGEQGCLPSRLTQQTGIRVNRQVIETHTNALLGQIGIRG